MSDMTALASHWHDKSEDELLGAALVAVHVVVHGPASAKPFGAARIKAVLAELKRRETAC